MTTAEITARKILADNGVEGEPHPALLEDTIREVEYHGVTVLDFETATPAPEPEEKPFKSYNVIGLDTFGVRRIVKTEARTVAEARENAKWVLDKIHRVIRP